MTKEHINSPLRLSYQKGNIVAVIYYNHKTFRYNLAKVPKECFLEKSMILKQSNKLTNPKQLADEISNKTELLKKVADELIKTLSSGETLKKRIVDERMMMLTTSGLRIKDTRSTHNLFTEDFRIWLYEGKGNKRKKVTKKDFISAYRWLQDFEYDTGQFTIDDIDDDFLDRIVEYSYGTRKNTEEHTYFTRGNLSNRTINKRLDSLYTFINEYYGINPKLKANIKHLEVIDKKIIRLNKEEMRELEELNIKEPELAQARDFFLFLCYTGLRFGDFAKLDRSFVDSETNELVLHTNKTGKPCRIFLFDTAKEIGEKYDFHFAPVSNQVLNRQIKELLRRYDLMSEDITTDFQAKKRETVTKKKREYIGCHTGRRTFISMLAEEGLDVYDIMSATGHTTFQMVQKYIDLFGKDRRQKFEAINNKNKSNYKTNLK